LIEQVTYRNLLSHGYHGIDEEKLFILTTKITTIQDFVDPMLKNKKSGIKSFHTFLVILRYLDEKQVISIGL